MLEAAIVIERPGPRAQQGCFSLKDEEIFSLSTSVLSRHYVNGAPRREYMEIEYLVLINTAITGTYAVGCPNFE